MFGLPSGRVHQCALWEMRRRCHGQSGTEILHPMHRAADCKRPRMNESRFADVRVEHRLMKYVYYSLGEQGRTQGQWVGPIHVRRPRVLCLER
jgi:hypothetical protein